MGSVGAVVTCLVAGLGPDDEWQPDELEADIVLLRALVHAEARRVLKGEPSRCYTTIITEDTADARGELGRCLRVAEVPGDDVITHLQAWDAAVHPLAVLHAAWP